MAWGVPFLLGVVVVFAVTNGIDAVFDLAPAESRQMGVPWIAAAIGGLTIVLSMLPLGHRLGKMVHYASGVR